MDDKQIIEGLKQICQCQGIAKKRFLEFISAGVHTVDELKQVTGAGSGSCGGKRCTPRIENLVATFPVGE